MSDICEKCAESGQAVPLGLVRHQLRQAWQRDLEGKEFNFCEAPECDTVYFTTEGERFGTGDVRRPSAYKTGNPEDLLCFCFDVSGSDVLADPSAVQYIRERVRNGQCVCDVLNPAGGCCLGSIGRWLKSRAPATAAST